MNVHQARGQDAIAALDLLGAWCVHDAADHNLDLSAGVQ
jgi:hypothetical protein